MMPCLVHTYSRSSPSGKAASEEVPMEDNPAYGEVNLYDTVKEPEENWLQTLVSTATVVFYSYYNCVTLHFWYNNR